MKKEKFGMIRHSSKECLIMLTDLQQRQIRSLYQQKVPIKEIVRQTGLARNTIRKYCRSDDVVPRQTFLQSHQEQIREWFLLCEGHCVPLKRMILEKLKTSVQLRTLQHFCKPFRKEVKACAVTQRYETAPGQQLQIDFGERDVIMGGEAVRVHVFVAILSFSRKIFAKAYPAENQGAWLNGLESSFDYYNGVPVTVLSDNSKCLVVERKKKAQVRLTQGYLNFCEYWNVKPVVAAPYYPQCKGKVERAVRYVKENALVGKQFESMSDLNQWLERWCRSIADLRCLDDFIQGLRTPKERFYLEKPKLQPLDKPHIASIREETRRVDKTGLIRVDNAYYRVPDCVANKDVQIMFDDNTIMVTRKGVLVIELDKTEGVYQPKQQQSQTVLSPAELPAVTSAYANNPLQRSLKDYAEAIGWQ